MRSNRQRSHGGILPRARERARHNRFSQPMVPPHGPEMDSHALSPYETSNPKHLQDWGAGYLAPWRQDQGMGYHHQSELHHRVDTMSRLLMRHEMELMALRVDTGFVMHLGAGPRGIIKQVMQASKEYYDAKTKQPRMQLTLKQTLLLAVFRILKERLAKLETETDLIGHVRKLGWMHATENQWHYLRWLPEKEALVPEDPVRVSSHAALQAHIENIMTLLEEAHVLHQFNTIKRLTPDIDQTLPFFIKVSLQGANAQNLFQRLLHLCGLGCLQMVDMTLRRERLEPQKLSKQVQQGMRKW